MARLELAIVGTRPGASRPTDLGLGGHQVGLCRRHGGLLDRDLNLVRLLVELDQQVPLLHAVVVIDQDPATWPATRGATKVTWPLT